MKVLMATAQHWMSPFQVGSHHIARAFVRNGWQVGFISDPISPWHFLGGVEETLRERCASYRDGGRTFEEGYLWAYVPGAFLTPHNKPILRSEWVHRNWVSLTMPDLRKTVKVHGFDRVDLLYLDVPTQHFWLHETDYRRSVFRISDRYSAFSKFPDAARTLEREVAGAVDLTLYSAHALKDYVEALQPRRMMVFPNGVDYDFFDGSPKELPQEYRSIPKPRVVYAGALDFWFDYQLVNEAAKRLSDFSFILIGPRTLANERLERLPNLHLLGARPYTDLPAYYRHADAGMIPFNVKAYADLVHSVHPLKLYEYMACGLPVVAARWRELETLDSPAILYADVEEFVYALRQAIEHKPDENELKDFARAARWQQRLDTLLMTLGLNAGLGATR